MDIRFRWPLPTDTQWSDVLHKMKMADSIVTLMVPYKSGVYPDVTKLVEGLYRFLEHPDKTFSGWMQIQNI